MAETDHQLKELNGAQLYQSFLAGAKRIFDNQILLNKINVFPVPDADTGTNLASTMRSIMDAIIPTNNPKETAVALADAALIGARGNSGIIFAQFLYGFSNEIKSEQALDVHAFAESMKKAVVYAYEAIANPVEGTILTVIKDWAEYMYALKDLIDDFIKLLIAAYQKALQSLAGTTRQLEVLARSHVVDAGAKGFVVFLEGIIDFLSKGGSVNEVAGTASREAETAEVPPDLHEEITFRYCAEALIAGEGLSRDLVARQLVHAGDSLVIAGSPKKMRVHLHTDFPAEAFHILEKFGNITYQKVDDMIMQNEILHNRKSDIAILTDSSCDLPKEILDRYQVHVIPLTVHFGETFFLDRVTIQPPQFYSMLEQSEHRPTTAQPALKDFQNKYEYLATHYSSVIGINISEAMSGTFFNSSKAGMEVAERTGKAIRVFNSRSLTGGLGLTVLRMARAIAGGTSYDELLPKVEEWIGKSSVFVSVPTLKYIVRSGRVSPFKGFVARMLDLKPVISIDSEGRSTLSGKSFTEKGCIRKVLKNIRKIAEKQRIWEYAISHADNEKVAMYYRDEILKLTGKEPVFLDNASPVLCAHTGPGLVCVSVMVE